MEKETKFCIGAVVLALTVAVVVFFVTSNDRKATKLSLEIYACQIELHDAKANDDTTAARKAAEASLESAKDCLKQNKFADCKRHIDCARVNLAVVKNGDGLTLEQVQETLRN